MSSESRPIVLMAVRHMSHITHLKGWESIAREFINRDSVADSVYWSDKTYIIKL